MREDRRTQRRTLTIWKLFSLAQFHRCLPCCGIWQCPWKQKLKTGQIPLVNRNPVSLDDGKAHATGKVRNNSWSRYYILENDFFSFFILNIKWNDIWVFLETACCWVFQFQTTNGTCDLYQPSTTTTTSRSHAHDYCCLINNELGSNNTHAN
jgi:hypothetical protein